MPVVGPTLYESSKQLFFWGKKVFSVAARMEIEQRLEVSQGDTLASTSAQLAATGVRLYIENNRGSCFDTHLVVVCFGLYFFKLML